MPETRTSSTIRLVEAVGTGLGKLLVGASLFIPGLIWFITELQTSKGCGEKLHIPHICIAVGMMVAGGICVNPPFGKQLTGIFVTVFPNGLPILGGRRSTDPQPPSDGEPK